MSIKQSHQLSFKQKAPFIVLNILFFFTASQLMIFLETWTVLLEIMEIPWPLQDFRSYMWEWVLVPYILKLFVLKLLYS